MGRSHAAALLAAMGIGCGATPPAFPDPADATDADGTSTSTMADASGSTFGDVDASSTSGAPADTGSTTSSANDGSGPGPAACGDGIMESGEACDDANRSQIDGCTSSCEVGPIAVGRVGEVQASPLLTYGNEAELALHADCPAGAAVVGIDIGWPKGVGGITVRCADLSLLDADPTAIEVGQNEALPPLGAYPGDDYALLCPAGEVFGELSAAGTSGAMFGFGATCRTFDVLGSGGGQSLTIGAGESLPYQGFMSGGRDDTSCPPQMVATGVTLQVLVSQWPVGIGLRCHPLELVTP